MYVVATAGHVDHGKSTLVRALTGMEPDRFEEERRRGLTIDLGYAWTRLDGDELAFVDVPGHERFIATMLAGLGPAPAVMFVVAADEGWRRQSTEHLAAVDALGLQYGLLVVTRSDLADPQRALAEARARIAGSSLGDVPAVAVSGRTGTGLDDLRTALGALVRSLPTPRTDGRVRLWVDRSFVIRGAGPVVTGTLSSGRLTTGDPLRLGDHAVRVRGLQTLGTAQPSVAAVARVAVNLRGIEADQVRRGDALLTPDNWVPSGRLDVRVLPALADASSPDPAATNRQILEAPLPDLPAELLVHVGTASVAARLRRLGGEMVRLRLDRELPVESGDRLVLRDPGRHAIVGGGVVLDADPPELRRRGAARARAGALRRVVGDEGELWRERLAREGLLRAADVPAEQRARLTASGAHPVDGWLVAAERWDGWRDLLTAAVDRRAREAPLDPRISVEAGRRLLTAPSRELTAAAAAAAGLVVTGGWIARADTGGLDPHTEAALAALERHLAASPFAAPERPELEAWGLGLRELAAAERLGRVVRLAPDLVLLPTGPALAMRELAALPQPFTTSQARQALGTTRRVVIPLLEHLDRRGWTQRLDAGHRRVRR